MTDNRTKTMEELTKVELLSAIRKQIDAAAKDIPHIGAAALRDLAEAYAIATAPTFPQPGLLTTSADGS
ncbi:hypothetical protein [Streptomyces cadmiisoli]|uniref:hypothetical protein n=1 Tax=Streptomyces cadmiisoli TaxID=2184053 RepID=UPI003D7473A7